MLDPPGARAAALPIASLIIWRGQYRVVGLPQIARLVRRGLTAHDVDTIALVAHEYRLDPSDLMRRALYSEVVHG